MKEKTKYNLQFARDCVLVLLAIIIGIIVVAGAIAKQKWAFIAMASVVFMGFTFMINEWRKDYIADKNMDKIFENEINIVMNKVVQCKKCKINPIVQFIGFNCFIQCPKCGKSTGGGIDPLDDIAEWNKINKKQRREK